MTKPWVFPESRLALQARLKTSLFKVGVNSSGLGRIDDARESARLLRAEFRATHLGLLVDVAATISTTIPGARPALAKLAYAARWWRPGLVFDQRFWRPRYQPLLSSPAAPRRDEKEAAA
jgi:hypothetical protein